MEKDDLIRIILIVVALGLGLFLVLISNIDNDVISKTNNIVLVD